MFFANSREFFYNAVTTVNSLRVVCQDGVNIRYADSSDLSTAFNTIGITRTAGSGSNSLYNYNNHG